MTADDGDLITAYGAPFGTHPVGPLMARLTAGIQLGRHGPWNRARRSLAKRILRRSRRLCDVEYRGLNLRLLPFENAHDLDLVLLGKTREEDEIALFDARAKASQIVVDIGANIGIYTLLAARRMGPSGRVIAFEPHPRTAAKLRGNIALNPGRQRVTVVQKAVGDAHGQLPMHIVADFDAGQNSLIRGHRHGSGRTVQVDVTPLVDALAEQGIEQIDILKIDIEGYEDRALSPFFGTAPSSLWPRYVMLEVAHRSRWHTDLVGEMTARGYEIVFDNTLNLHLARGDTA